MSNTLARRPWGRLQCPWGNASQVGFHRGDQDWQSTPHITDSLPIGLNLLCNYVYISNQLCAPLTVQPDHLSALSYVEGTPNVLAGHKSWPPPTRAFSRPGGITKIMIQNGFMDLLAQVFLSCVFINLW